MFLTQIDDVRFSSYAANGSADMESRGFNLGLGYGWADGFLRASYSRSKVEVDGAGTDSYTAIDLGAPLGGVFAIEAQHTQAQYDLTVGGSIEAAQRYRDTEVDADREIPGYAVLNLFAEYAPAGFGRLVIRGEIDNVLDKEYADRATYGQDFSSVEPLYEPGRNISLVLTKRF